MTTTLAQFIVLATYGNQFLKGNIQIPDAFNNTNTTFQFCSKINFLNSNAEIISNSPEEWFIYLKETGCKALKLYYQSSSKKEEDHQLAGFVGGGGIWLIEAEYKNYSDYWSSQWEYQSKARNTKKPWVVTYRLAYPEHKSYNIQIEPSEMKEKMRKILLEISDFAYRVYGPDTVWGKRFHQSLSILKSDSPWERYYHKDLLPDSKFPLLTQQLLFCAGNSFVFGGMGSWNDTYFENKEEQQEYNTLSEELYSGIMNSILAAVNWDN